MEQEIKRAEVVAIEPIGIGSRVCLDLIDQLDPLEGIFVGNTGYGYIKVLSENRTTETYPARPFRINGGAIHQYVSIGESKTTYLSEVKPGSELPIRKDEEIRQVAVGRVKIEKRKFLRVICKVDDVEISATLQESDSVHVQTENGAAKAVIDLQMGDKIICLLDQPGRHLGEKIEEEIAEF
ncbi:3-dehydroquinate synthase [Aquibacillus koreensis]|uniref:3-dehydroquinate synthase n=1 Tax=Aquibacillus koreensis TaxID=279446 RepID=A0A9X3WP98_9BACI|nr:3-dehydroquinate synthase II [Aquibacillus koreensis]MCT2538182.1 3-dehydroquinate synthase [Aquibacillus koreensis]MDC3420874.1 3-dehydroquinate synthase [Aquibacillus koreensis]